MANPAATAKSTTATMRPAKPKVSSISKTPAQLGVPVLNSKVFKNPAAIKTQNNSIGGDTMFSPMRKMKSNKNMV